MRHRWQLRKLSFGPVWISLIAKNLPRRKRATKKAIERRRKIFDKTRPHHGDDLIKALEFENFMTDYYAKGQ